MLKSTEVDIRKKGEKKKFDFKSGDVPVNLSTLKIQKAAIDTERRRENGEEWRDSAASRGRESVKYHK